MFNFLSETTFQDALWFGIGMTGQLMFSARFLYQWFRSEQARRSVVPVPFWYFSLLGGMTLLIYAIRQQDPVIIIGQAFGILIYGRNIFLILRERRGTGAVEINSVAAS